MKRRDWEEQAENWVRWARAPEHDSYVDYAEAFFEELVPAAGDRTLDLGCGEGRVARDLTSRGHRVVGIDASPTLLAAARDADPIARYLIADAAALPFPDGSFDLVVAYNTLMDFDDLPRAVREAARVLVAGGRLCACVVHPVAEDGIDHDDRRSVLHEQRHRSHGRDERTRHHDPPAGAAARPRGRAR